MINLQTIVAINSSAILLLLIVLFNARTTIRRELLDSRLFFLMAVTTIAQAVIDTVSFFTTGVAFPGSYWFNVIINDLLYINNAFFAFLWVLYVDSKLFEDVQRMKKHYVIVGIPAMLMIAGSIANLFVPVFFSIDRITFVYARTDLYTVATLVTMFYLLYGFVLTCRYKSRNKNHLFFPALIFLIPIVLAAATEYFFYGLNVLWIGAAISLTSVYINLQNQVSYTDSLSGLLTRQYLTRYLLTEMKKSSPEKKLVGIMLDIDKFKAINDTYGHLAGDEAISTVGKILRHAMTSDSAAFRFGGDEFMVILTVRNQEEIAAIIHRIESLTAKFNEGQGDSYQLNFSIGSAVYDKGMDTFDGFLERMDTAMYFEKKKKAE